MDAYQQFIFTRTYARWLPGHNRRETWEEAVDRLCGFYAEIAPQLPKQDHADIKQAILNMECLPSMRLLSMAGEAVHRNNLCAYNCSYLPIDCIDAFAECLLILMNGTGVGFSVETEYVDKLPRIVRQKDAPALSYKIEDSTDGWVDALRTGMQIWFNGGDVTFDYSSIRPEGSPLRTKGGYSSGQGPLQSLLEFIRDRLLASQSRRLEPIDCHDIVCRIGETVCVGNVRRAALISLSDLDDVAIRGAKDGQFWLKHPYRTQSNNSAVYNSKPPAVEFLTEWLSLAKSGSGERGIFNRGGVIDSLPARRQNTGDYGCNPCQPGFATLLTPNGIKTFDDVEVGDIIWSGKHWTSIVRKLFTGVKTVWAYRTKAGVVHCTREHQVMSNGVRVQAHEALTIDITTGGEIDKEPINPQDVMDGLIVGDGSRHIQSYEKVYLVVGEANASLLESVTLKPLFIRHRPGVNSLYWAVQTTVTPTEVPRTFDRTVPERFRRGASTTKMRGFLRGLYSANGSVCGRRVTLKAASFDVICQVREMLSALGIRSYYVTNHPYTAIWHNGTYTSRTTYDLNTSNQELFRALIGFEQPHKAAKLDAICGSAPGKPKLSYEVLHIDSLDKLPVYDITVDDPEHTYWTGGHLVSNCGEINLRPCQLCNLSEVVARTEDDEFHLLRKVRLATIMGTIQATLTHFPGLRPEWRQNCEEERLLGVSLTGIMDCSAVRSVYLLEKLRAHAIEINKKYAALLKINQSAAITCVKPSGTVSQLVNSSSGIHCRWSQYYIRRIRISALDPLFAMMKALGVPHFPEVGQSSHNASIWVLEFPVKSPDGATTRHDLTALDQLENWLVFKGCYTEHNPSATVYVGADEWVAVGAWVYENWDQIGGLSFLPKTDYVYSLAPYEEIARREYEKRVAEFPDIDYNLLSKYEQFDQTTSEMEMACVGGACEIH